MTIDERLQFLLQSTESLHATVAEMAERMDREHEAHQREREAQRLEMAKHQRAVVLAIQAYLEALDDGGADAR